MVVLQLIPGYRPLPCIDQVITKASSQRRNRNTSSAWNRLRFRLRHMATPYCPLNPDCQAIGVEFLGIVARLRFTGTFRPKLLPSRKESLPIERYPVS